MVLSRRFSVRSLVARFGWEEATPCRYFRSLLNGSHLTLTGPRTNQGKTKNEQVHKHTSPDTQGRGWPRDLALLPHGK